MEGKHENLRRFAILKTSFRVPQMLTGGTAHQALPERRSSIPPAGKKRTELLLASLRIKRLGRGLLNFKMANR